MNPHEHDPRPDPSANATTHGLTARRPLHEQEAERIKVMYDHWMSTMHPETGAEEALVGTAAIEYVRYVRCVKAEEARMRPSSEDALKDWQDRRRHAARRRGQDLAADPEAVVADLSESSFGIDWMLRRWRQLRALLDPTTGPAAAAGGVPGWGPADLATAMHLLGREASAPPDADRSEAARLWRAAPDAFPDAFELPSTKDRAEALALVRSSVDRALARLEALRPIVWEEVDLPRLDAVEASSMIDTSKEGQLRQRYRREAFRDYQRALAELNRLRNDRSKMAAREARIAAQSPPVDDFDAWRAKRAEAANRAYAERTAAQSPDPSPNPNPDATPTASTDARTHACAEAPDRGESPAPDRPSAARPVAPEAQSSGRPADAGEAPRPPEPSPTVSRNEPQIANDSPADDRRNSFPDRQFRASSPRADLRSPGRTERRTEGRTVPLPTEDETLDLTILPARPPGPRPIRR
jgi:hypothetical protein